MCTTETKSFSCEPGQNCLSPRFLAPAAGDVPPCSACGMVADQAVRLGMSLAPGFLRAQLIACLPTWLFPPCSALILGAPLPR